MKRQLLLILIFLLPLVIHASDVAVVNADGITIYYNFINNGTELEVTFRGDKHDSYNNEYANNVVIPEEVTLWDRTCKVTYIGDYAFRNCSGLTSVTIPNSVTNVGMDAFGGCTSLISVHIYDLEAWCKIVFRSSASNPLFFAHNLFLKGVEIKDLIIPNSVTSIGDYAFSGYSGLTSVTIPNSVKNIGMGAFWSCTGLTSVNIPNSVTNIGGKAFYGCI